MTNDIEILQQIQEELKKADHPPFGPAVIDLYARLVDRVPEDGFEQHLPDKEISEQEEQALGILNHYHYLEVKLKPDTLDGHIWHVNLRGKRFLDIEDKQVASVVFGMKDSGKRDTFETGAVRDSAEGKPRPDLFSPFAMERIGRWLEMGARKYEPNNWQRGMKYSRVTASLCRHLMMYLQHDLSEDHLAALAVNISFLMHYDAMIERGVLPESLDDMPKYQAVTNDNEFDLKKEPNRENTIELAKDFSARRQDKHNSHD
ncbi:MAG: DUF5664 domain-containing protein [Planctomycetaceae bacterium]|nr:DUF5664 domain-containing protein [Planctomycetaceae bacterium]